MSLVENKLNAVLFRMECPSNLELGEYTLNLLDVFRQKEIEIHQGKCPHCQTDLVEIRQFMNMPLFEEPVIIAEKESVFEKVKVMFVDLLQPPKIGLPGSTWQPAFRGGQDILTRVIHAEPYVIALSSLKDLSSWQKQKIIGDISGDTDDQENFHNWNVYLWRAGKLLATSPVDRDSHFYFDDIELKNQPHELILSGPKVEILLQNLQMA